MSASPLLYEKLPAVAVQRRRQIIKTTDYHRGRPGTVEGIGSENCPHANEPESNWCHDTALPPSFTAKHF